MKLPKLHLIVFVLGGFGFLAYYKWVGTFPIFWMLLIWGVVVTLHMMYSLSLKVDDCWASKRADELVDNAYDVDHIENIRERRTTTKN